MMSIERSGVLTWTAPSMSSQCARDVGKHGVEIGGAVARDQRPRAPPRRGLAQEENDFGAAAGRQLERRAQRAAGIETGADPLGQRRAPRAPRAWPSVPLRPMNSRRSPVQSSAPAQIGEGDARTRRPRSRDCARTSRRSRASISVDDERRAKPRDGPSTHST
jgi:hypothetical protein